MKYTGEIVPFTTLKQALSRQYTAMQKMGQLFVTDVNKDTLYDTYLGSFPEGTNNVYRERREYDCNCCKQFIRAVGGVVAVNSDNSLTSIWDINVGGYYQPVVYAMSAYVKSKAIANEFFHFERTAGTDKSYDAHTPGKEWDHFFVKIPDKYFKLGAASAMADSRSNKEVLMRSFEELSLGSAEIVLELIDQNSLYRGTEHKATVQLFVKQKKRYDKLPAEQRDNFCWVLSKELGGSSKFRNTVIGTLLSDISEGVELEVAVKKFEAKVAPANYKRPTALITQSMIKKAQQKVEQLGIEDSLHRRYATAEDLTINNVLFADRSAKNSLQGGVFNDLLKETATKAPNLDRVQEMSVDDFIENVLPTATTIEMFVENKHSGNFMSVIAPQYPDAPNLMKWGNNFSWTYNGEVTDSIKERVKAAGGVVDAPLCNRLSWFNGDDLDLSVIEPNGERIYYASRTHQGTGGHLDVDMNAGRINRKDPVENIYYRSESRIPIGVYEVVVHNFMKRDRVNEGFVVEVDYKGDVTTFEYDKPVKDGERITVCKYRYTGNGIEFLESLPSTSRPKELWNVSTQNWHKVNMIMNSPNHWDGEETGNKHTFFILEGCRNDDPARGFYNELLSNDLTEHRKVFEVLGSKMKTPGGVPDKPQLSGVGFSSTIRNSVTLKVTGKTNRIINVTF